MTSSTEATASPDHGAGGPAVSAAPGDRLLLVPDRIGNNRLDGLPNILGNPHVGLFFLPPGSPTTQRVAGRARIVSKQVNEFGEAETAELLTQSYRDRLC